MSFDEVRFPEKVAYGASGGPTFSTTITELYGGFEQRNQNWSVSRGRWDISTGIKNNTEFAEVLAFFRARKGRARGFRFKDWSDYTATAQNIGTGTGALLTFQLKKTYTSGGVTYSRTITKPVSGTLSVFVDSVLKVEGGGNDYTVNYNTGVVTFNGGSVPPNTQEVTATFEFDVPVRFDTDNLSARITNHNQYVSESIPLVELRV
jgi:uncharacterized protein (TIGR02217 family)